MQGVWETLTEWMQDIGFTQSKNDPCVYHRPTDRITSDTGRGMVHTGIQQEEVDLQEYGYVRSPEMVLARFEQSHDRTISDPGLINEVLFPLAAQDATRLQPVIEAIEAFVRREVKSAWIAKASKLSFQDRTLKLTMNSLGYRASSHFRLASCIAYCGDIAS